MGAGVDDDYGVGFGCLEGGDVRVNVQGFFGVVVVLEGVAVESERGEYLMVV